MKKIGHYPNYQDLSKRKPMFEFFPQYIMDDILWFSKNNETGITRVIGTESQLIEYLVEYTVKLADRVQQYDSVFKYV